MQPQMLMSLVVRPLPTNLRACERETIFCVSKNQEIYDKYEHYLLVIHEFKLGKTVR
jgi:hypothetical protein